jgi:PAS domain S-box-containing protein
MEDGSRYKGNAVVADVLERSRDLVVAFDREGKTTYRNLAAVSRVSSDDGIAANNIGEAQRAQFLAAVQASAAGESTAFDWGESGPSGVRFWFSAEVTPVSDGGLCISRDVTELKRNEQRFRRSEQMLVDTQGVAHLGTWEWDITQPTATWSAELFRIYGLTPETYKPSYEQYLTMVHEDDRQRVIDATNRVFHEHVPYSHDERIYRPDGSLRYLHTWAFPLLDDAGKLTHLIGVCQDITDRATAEEALHQLNTQLEERVSRRTEQLESALRELEGFNSMVSHDLRAPLAVIQMSVDMIARDTDSPSEKTASYLDRVRRAIKNMSSLMDDLLMLAKVGQGSLQVRAVDVSTLCSEIVAELRAASPERNVEVTIEPGALCIVDASLFRSVLVNLIGNAWKYSSKREVAHLEVGIVERADGRALFVRDDGIGFDMADRPKLFMPFERLKGAADFSGTGIGLAIVRRILERHGGRVDVESVPDKGATFFAMLPVEAWQR